MNIDELKLLLDAINQFTSQATTAGIWWAALHYTLPALTKITGILVGGVVVVKVARTIAASYEWARVGRSVSKAFGGDGYTYGFYYNDEQAINKAIATASELAKKK